MATRRSTSQRGSASRRPATRRAAPARSAGGTVDVGRLGAETVQVRVSRGSTVGRVLREAGFDLNGERIMVNGAIARESTVVHSGDLVLILTPKQAGR